jgi:hypothetical protein
MYNPAMKFITQISTLALLLPSLHAAPIPENLRQNGWFIGAQAYTFKEFSAFEAIAKTKEAGGNLIEFYPGQKLKPGSTNKVHHTMSEASMNELLAECARLGVHDVRQEDGALRGVHRIHRADCRVGSGGEGIRHQGGVP